MDIVFALDTTGSMDGLLAGAKAKIWDIARQAQRGQPTPDLRVGLVAYRDNGDTYVTKVTDLTADLDKVYARLSSLRADGGGDNPEHVIRGLHDAVHVHWSDDPEAVKIVYLVGDAPPHYDYKDGLTMSGVLAEAKQRGIRISAIRCGDDPSTLVAWRQIASATKGDVATIEQQGGVVAVATPYDGELARLNAALARTEVHYGTDSERRALDADTARSLAAPAIAQADRAAFMGAAGASAKPMKQDLVASKGALAHVSESELPADLRAMDPGARESFVEGKKKERGEILAQIRDVSARRDEALKHAAPKPAATALDTKVMDSLRKAGEEKGIAY